MSFGHIIHGDTLIPLILVVGNMFIFFTFLLLKIFEIIIFIFEVTMRESNIIRIVIFGVLNLFMFLVVQLIQIILLINQRR